MPQGNSGCSVELYPLGQVTSTFPRMFYLIHFLLAQHMLSGSAFNAEVGQNDARHATYETCSMANSEQDEVTTPASEATARCEVKWIAQPVMSITQVLTSRSLFFDETVKVVVGTGQAQAAFTVHTSVLIQHSTFFASVLSGRWEDVHRAIQLLHDEATIFDRYLAYVYRRDTETYDNKNTSAPQSYEPQETLSDEELDSSFLYVKVYVLADKLGDCVSANAVVDKMVKGRRTRLGAMLQPRIAKYV